MHVLPPALSSYAGEVDFIIMLVAYITGFWLFLSEAVFFYFIWKFHKSRSPRSQYITGEEKHQTKWISWPHNVVLLCDVAIIYFAVSTWYHIKQDIPKPDETVRVVGHQWAWEFQHPGPGQHDLNGKDDVGTVDELHVIVGKVYNFKLQSADVLHDFSVPVFRLKQDAIPGREITGWFKATEVGQWDIQCAKMCGMGHGVMGARIFVETQEQHDAWLQKAKATAGVSLPAGPTQLAQAKP